MSSSSSASTPAPAANPLDDPMADIDGELSDSDADDLENDEDDMKKMRKKKRLDPDNDNDDGDDDSDKQDGNNRKTDDKDDAAGEPDFSPLYVLPLYANLPKDQQDKVTGFLFLGCCFVLFCFVCLFFFVCFVYLFFFVCLFFSRTPSVMKLFTQLTLRTAAPIAHYCCVMIHITMVS